MVSARAAVRQLRVASRGWTWWVKVRFPSWIKPVTWEFSSYSGAMGSRLGLVGLVWEQKDIIIIIIIIITFKGAIWDFLQSLHWAANCLKRTLKWPGRNHVQITCNTSSIYRVQHVVLHATGYKGTAQLSSLTEFKSHLFELYFIGWTSNRWRSGGNRSTWRKPLATSFRKCHILKPEDSSPKRDEPEQQHWWQARKADMLTVTPHDVVG